MDDLLNKVIPVVRQHSEDLWEEEYYLRKHWIEVRDDEEFHRIVMHIFNPDGEYLCSTDGDIECGEWRHLGNKLLFGPSNCDGEVFELAFLDEDFFILMKHGNYRKFSQRYRVFVREPLAKRMEWNESIEYLFDKYRNTNGFFMTIVVLLLLIIVVVLLLS